jgi:hypothetical protein
VANSGYSHYIFGLTNILPCFCVGELNPQVCPSILVTPHINQVLSANFMRHSLAYRPEFQTRLLHLRGHDLWGCPFSAFRISYIFCCIIELDNYLWDSGFGGLACWPLVPKFAGSYPAETVGFFKRKNPQHAYLRRGSKSRLSHVVLYGT